MKKLISVLFVVSACSASVDDNSAGDDTGDDGGGEDPGEMTESATVRFLFTTVHDERGDTIELASGEPVHTHAGPPVMLGGTTCPDVYKYAYLMDSTPAFGEETTPNPLQWKVELKNTKSLDPAGSAYRVRTADNTIALDWSPLPELVDAVSTITLTRDAIGLLGEQGGEYFIDIRTRDTAGEETITSACWNHHPLAAPVEVQQAQVDIGGLTSMTLIANSPISHALSASGTAVYTQRFVHHTAESITLTIDVAKPTGSYTKRVVDDFVVSATAPTFTLCENEADGFVSDDPICSDIPPADPADSSGSGALAAGDWSLLVIDESNGAPACSVSGLRATCQLAPRPVTAAATPYRIYVVARNLADLAPAASGTFSEHTIDGLTFTGKTAETTKRCTQYSVKVFPNGTTAKYCRNFAEYTRIQALDHVRVAFDAVPFTLAASPNTTLAAEPLHYMPAALATAAPKVWDAGDDDLPGPQ